MSPTQKLHTSRLAKVVQKRQLQYSSQGALCQPIDLLAQAYIKFFVHQLDCCKHKRGKERTFL